MFAKFHDFRTIRSKKNLKKLKNTIFLTKFDQIAYFGIKIERIKIKKIQRQFLNSQKMTIRLIYHSIPESKIFLKFFLGHFLFWSYSI